MNQVYEPSEDTYLLLKYLDNLTSSKRVFKRSLEIGSGKGLITEKLLEISEEVYAIAIMYQASKETLRRIGKSSRKNVCHIVCGDLLTMFRKSVFFDLIISNPPYLEPEDLGDVTIEGGSGFIKRLIKESLQHLKQGGLLVFVASPPSGTTNKYFFIKDLIEEELTINIALSRRLFFEELVVYEIVKNYSC
ncbi:MAG: methyltransferase [Nitrososphaerota archaeon]